MDTGAVSGRLRASDFASAAKAELKMKEFIAAVNRCATQDQRQELVSRRGPVLLRRYQRMRDRVHRERDAVLHSYFAHQFGYVRFYGAFFYA
jgi:hypothetical protein